MSDEKQSTQLVNADPASLTASPPEPSPTSHLPSKEELRAIALQEPDELVIKAGTAMSIHQRRCAVRDSIKNAEQDIIAFLEESTETSHQLGAYEAVALIMSSLQMMVKNRFSSLLNRIPPIDVAEDWDRDQLHHRLHQLRDEVRIHRLRINRHRKQFEHLAEQYRRLRGFNQSVRSTLWVSLCRLVEDMESKGISTHNVVSRFAAEWPEPGGDLTEAQLESMLTLADNVGGLQIFSEEDVQMRVAEEVSKMRIEEERKLHKVEAELADRIAQEPTRIREAVNAAAHDAKRDKHMFSLLRKEYEAKIDQLQDIVDGMKQEAEQRLNHARQIKELQISGMSKTMENVQGDLLQLRKYAQQLELDLARSQQSEETIKFEMLEKLMEHKREVHGHLRMINELKVKLGNIQPKEQIIAEATEPLHKKMAGLEKDLSEQRDINETLRQQLREEKHRSDALQFDANQLSTWVDDLKGKTKKFEEEVYQSQTTIRELREERLKHVDEIEVTRNKCTWQAEQLVELRRALHMGANDGFLPTKKTEPTPSQDSPSKKVPTVPSKVGIAGSHRRSKGHKSHKDDDTSDAASKSQRSAWHLVFKDFEVQCDTTELLLGLPTSPVCVTSDPHVTNKSIDTVDSAGLGSSINVSNSSATTTTAATAAVTDAEIGAQEEHLRTPIQDGPAWIEALYHSLVVQRQKTGFFVDKSQQFPIIVSKIDARFEGSQSLKSKSHEKEGEEDHMSMLPVPFAATKSDEEHNNITSNQLDEDSENRLPFTPEEEGGRSANTPTVLPVYDIESEVEPHAQLVPPLGRSITHKVPQEGYVHRRKQSESTQTEYVSNDNPLGGPPHPATSVLSEGLSLGTHPMPDVDVGVDDAAPPPALDQDVITTEGDGGDSSQMDALSPLRKANDKQQTDDHEQPQRDTEHTSAPTPGAQQEQSSSSKPGSATPLHTLNSPTEQSSSQLSPFMPSQPPEGSRRPCVAASVPGGSGIGGMGLVTLIAQLRAAQQLQDLYRERLAQDSLVLEGHAASRTMDGENGSKDFLSPTESLANLTPSPSTTNKKKSSVFLSVNKAPGVNIAVQTEVYVEDSSDRSPKQIIGGLQTGTNSIAWSTARRIERQRQLCSLDHRAHIAELIAQFVNCARCKICPQHQEMLIVSGDLQFILSQLNIEPGSFTENARGGPATFATSAKTNRGLSHSVGGVGVGGGDLDDGKGGSSSHGPSSRVSSARTYTAAMRGGGGKGRSESGDVTPVNYKPQPPSSTKHDVNGAPLSQLALVPIGDDDEDVEGDAQQHGTPRSTDLKTKTQQQATRANEVPFGVGTAAMKKKKKLGPSSSTSCVSWRSRKPANQTL